VGVDLSLWTRHHGTQFSVVSSGLGIRIRVRVRVRVRIRISFSFLLFAVVVTATGSSSCKILCMGNGVTFIDSTNPTAPVHLASMFSEQERSASWCDVKVHKDVAYVIKDSAPAQGIQVFDLNRLATEGNAAYPPSLLPDFKYQEHGSSHNLAIDTESEFLYSVGSNTCRGGLHMIDIRCGLGLGPFRGRDSRSGWKIRNDG
jgi:hypothetical protein